MPDLTIVLDLPAAAAAARINRQLDRMERQGADFHARVREGFLTEATRRGGIAVIDASAPIDEVQNAIRQAAAKLLAGR